MKRVRIAISVPEPIAGVIRSAVRRHGWRPADLVRDALARHPMFQSELQASGLLEPRVRWDVEATSSREAR